MGYQIIAIVILLVFYGCYFSKMISQKKKGIQTDQMGKGKKGFVKFIEIALKTVTILVPIVEVSSIFLNISGLPTVARFIGIVIALLGATIFIYSVFTMRDSWRAGVSETDKTELVTNGIYQISRNPAFLGFDLVYIGIVLMFFNWVLLGISGFAALMFHLQIVNVEEEFLLRAFGNEYLNYRNKVNRYLGKNKVRKGENMRQLSDKDADKYGIHTIHHEMDNGELRFRLVSENGSSYILTKSTVHNGWQNSHVHYQKSEFYVVEKGIVFIALLVENELKMKKLCENDSFSVPVGIAHNVRMSDNAILHTIKFGTQDEDWNSCPELDALLAETALGF